MSSQRSLLKRGLTTGALACALALLPLGAIQPAWATGPLGSLSPDPLNFGSVSVNDGAEVTIDVFNGGSAPLHITDATFTGSNPDDFDFDPSSPCFTSPTPVNNPCDLYLYFFPSDLGARSADITLTSDSTSPITDILQGTGNDGDGYYIATADGSTYSFGSADDIDDLGELNAPIVGMTRDPNGGFWEVASDGGVFAQDGSDYFGSMGGQPLNQPIVGMASTPDGEGYWLVASDGGIFSFGDAQFYGSMGGKPLNKPVVGMAANPDGDGYWLAAADGGIFSYGDVPFFGSMGGSRLNQPIVGMTTSPDGQGYRFVASDGGIFDYGDAMFYGSKGGQKLANPIIGMQPTATGDGYYLLDSGGGIFPYGQATFFGGANQDHVDDAVAMALS